MYLSIALKKSFSSGSLSASCPMVRIASQRGSVDVPFANLSISVYDHISKSPASGSNGYRPTLRSASACARVDLASFTVPEPAALVSLAWPPYSLARSSSV